MFSEANDQNFIYGITYVDHTTKSVFNGSDLGNEYSAAAIQERMQKEVLSTEVPNMKITNEPSERNYVSSNVHGQAYKNDLINILIEPSKTFHHLPYEFKKRKRKKRKL